METQKQGSAIGFMALLLKNFFASICPNPADKKRIPAIAEEIKRVAGEILSLAIAVFGACVITFLRSTREEENEEYP